MPQSAMPISSIAYTRSGCSLALMYFGSSSEPMHMPPMKVPSRTPMEIADEPTISESIWNQTTS